MIIGNGQLADTFKNENLEKIVIFASGVSNSNCEDSAEFEREKKLLIKVLSMYPDKILIYFSSCALSSQEYHKNKYYKHKIQMEEYVRQYSNAYYIFRLPQVFGELKKHSTILNFLYYKIKNKENFTVYSNAYRYVIEINDVVKLVMKYIEVYPSNLTIDFANPYKYSIIEIVEIFEILIGHSAQYNIIDKYDSYDLNLTPLESFVNKYELDMHFSKEYLAIKLNKQIKGIT